MLGPLPRSHIATLADKLRDGHLGLFIGAGLSRLASATDGSARRLPLWNELAKEVARACNVRAKAYRSILDLFDGIAGKRDRPTLERAVREALDDKPFDLSPAHQASSKLPWSAIFTTNYDGLLARAFDKTPFFEERDYEKLEERRDEAPLLFHLHGTLDWPHTLTRDDYRFWREKHPRAFLNLQKFVHDKTLLFVGYSLSDPHIDDLLALVRDITSGRPKEMFAWMWRLTKEDQELLADRDKIHAFPIRKEEDWANAFEDIASALMSGGAGRVAKPSATVDQFSYDREQYLTAAKVRYGVANLQGLYQWGAGYARDDVPLADVFVEPDLEIKKHRQSPGTVGETLRSMDADLSHESLSEAQRRRQEEQGAERATQRERASTVAARESRVLIVGAPGQGKSTLLRHLLLDALARWRESPTTQRFPVLVRLADWETDPERGEGWLSAHVRRKLPHLGEIGSAAVAGWLQGPVFWLLDGIDEVRDAHGRARLLDEVRAAASARAGDRWLLTTRPAGEPAGGIGVDWIRAELPSLSDAQVEAVIQRWAEVLLRKEGLALDHRQLARNLRTDPGLRLLRGNALLLTMAILFYKTRRRLPNDRWEFYVGAEQALRDSWVRFRHEGAGDLLPGDYMGDVLEGLALSGMENGRVLFTGEQFTACLDAVLRERGYTGGERAGQIARCLDAARDLIGVLVEQGLDRFGFLHLTFQEFYAARAVSHASEAERTRLIALFWDHPDWREVWPLYALAIQSEPTKLQHLFQAILASGDGLDAQLFRPQLACLRLAGLGGAPLPPTIAPFLDWAVEVLTGTAYPLFQIMILLAAWERRLTADVRDALLAGLADDQLGGGAARALAGAVGEREVRDALLARLTESDWKVRWAAVRALASAVNEEEIREVLLARLDDENPSVADQAERALLGAVNHPNVWSALVNRIRKTHTVMSEITDALGSVSEQRGALLGLLSDDDQQVRRAAIWALSNAARETEVRAALLSKVGEDRWVRKDAVKAFKVAARDPEIREQLLSWLDDDDGSVRSAAAWALAAAMGEAEVRAALLARLDDDDGSVRWAAAWALAAAVGEAEVRAALLARLGDDDGSVRWEAARALAAAVGEAEVRAALLARLGDHDGSVREAAARALAAAVGEAEVRAALLARLGDHDGSVRREAARALAAAVGEAEVRAALLARLGDAGISVRWAAVQALAGAAGEREVRDALLARLADRDLASAAAKVLGAGIIAEKFRLPAGEIDVVYP